jgi:Rrf2 family cysteine metabolism transcriptional repressor
MKIGSKGDYGLRALIDLAEHYDSRKMIQTRDIAQRQAIPKDYLAIIMVDLRRAGFVLSARGPSGGYRLAYPPGEISMGQVLRSLEGPVTLLDCTTELGLDACAISLKCRMRSVWIEANRAVTAILDSTTIADLCSTQKSPRGSQGSDLNMPEGHMFHI